MANAPYGERFYTQKTITARNTDTTTNINTASLTKVPIVGTIDSGFDTDFFTPDIPNNEIRVNFSGRIRVTAHVFFQGSVTRGDVALRIYVNGVARAVRGGGGYSRNSSGQSTSLAGIFDEFPVAANDIISIYGFQSGGAGTLTMNTASSSVFTIEKVLPNV